LRHVRSRGQNAGDEPDDFALLHAALTGRGRKRLHFLTGGFVSHLVVSAVCSGNRLERDRAAGYHARWQVDPSIQIGCCCWMVPDGMDHAIIARLRDHRPGIKYFATCRAGLHISLHDSSKAPGVLQHEGLTATFEILDAEE
jgi:hypothetical protein